MSDRLAKLLIILAGVTLITGAWSVRRGADASASPAPAFSGARVLDMEAGLRPPTIKPAAYQEDGGEEGGEDGDDGNLTAKISPQQAADSAVKAQPGAVTKVELENENGKAVYGVRITASDGKRYDVKVDGDTGKVLKIEADDDEA